MRVVVASEVDFSRERKTSEQSECEPMLKGDERTLARKSSGDKRIQVGEGGGGRRAICTAIYYPSQYYVVSCRLDGLYHQGHCAAPIRGHILCDTAAAICIRQRHPYKRRENMFKDFSGERQWRLTPERRIHTLSSNPSLIWKMYRAVASRRVASCRSTIAFGTRIHTLARIG